MARPVLRQQKTDGAAHGRITLWLGLFLLAPAIAASLELENWLPMLVPLGCLAGLFIEPDLDLMMVTSSEMRVIRIPVFGPILGAVWTGYWLPYAYWFRTRHRSVWTHFPGISTLIRLLYLYPLYALANHLGHLTITIEQATLLACGLVVSDIGHYLRDQRS